MTASGLRATMRSGRGGLATATLALLVCALEVTEADAQVVVEQYDAPRPASADGVMSIMRDEFGQNHLVALPEQVAKSLFQSPRPVIQDPKLTSDALIDELELAVRSYIKVNYPLAVVQLANALTHADANYGLIIQDSKAKYAMTRAQVALALTYKKQSEQLTETIAQLSSRIAAIYKSRDLELVASKREVESKKKELEAERKEFEAKKKGLESKASEAMTMYIRSSRDPVVRSMFGPPGEELYNDVRKTLDPAKRAKLAISVNEPEAQLFVNGLLVGRGATFTVDQLPGPHCVVIRVGQKMLRYDVTMNVGRQTVLDIDWSFDSALRISDRWVGLMLPNGTHFSAYVRKTAQRMGNQIALVFVGLRQERNYLVAYGYHYDQAYRDGYVLWSGEVHVGSMLDDLRLPESEKLRLGKVDELKLRDLVRHLSTGKPSDNVLAIGTQETSLLRKGYLQRSPWPAYAAFAGSLGAFTIGTYGLVNEYGCNQDTTCKDHYSRAALLGYTGVGMGIVLAVFGVYWLETASRDPPRSTVTLVPLKSGATISWIKEF